MHALHQRSRMAVLAFLVAVLVLAAGVVDANAALTWTDFTASLTKKVPDSANPGQYVTVPEHQAGAHADLTINFAQSVTPYPDPDVQPGDRANANIKDLKVDLPPGIIGNPTSFPTCSEADLNSPTGCPMDAQVGNLKFTANGVVNGEDQTPLTGTAGPIPIYNMQPPPGTVAAFGVLLFNTVPIHIFIKVRSDGDYGLTAVMQGINEALPLSAATTTLWGVPADSSHDAQRQYTDPSGNLSWGHPATGPLVPFLSNPTSCGSTPLPATLTANSWQDPATFVTDTTDFGGPISGCDELAFSPSVAVTPDNQDAGAPSGYEVKLSVPQSPGAAQLATPNVRDVVVRLPAGVTLNASSVDGLGSCSDAQFGLHDLNPSTCPDAAKIGTVSVDTPVLDDPVAGNVYLGTPLGNDPQSGTMYRLMLEATAPGLRVKLLGSVVADPLTGQLTATFTNNPQLPFSALTVDFKGGSRAPLRNPSLCGSYNAQASLTPWSSGTPTTVSGGFSIDSGCGGAGFTPQFSAGVTDPTSGSSSPFVMDLMRPDGQQDFGRIDMVLPPGLLANVGSVPLCGAAQAAAGTCDQSSQVGHVTVAAGAGPTPVYIPQAGKAPTAVYLAGPYQGAPFSLSIVVPAQAGPFDLGTVVVRAALFVDSNDAHVTVKSDPFPTILGGVPLEMQRVHVALDRPGFMVTPTNCAAQQVTAAVTSAQGATANVSSRFQMSGCAALPFNPQFSASSNGTLRFKQGAAFKVHIGMPAGDANIKSVSLRLPKELPSRLIPTINNACVLSQYVADYTKCPEDSYVGTVSATTPILPQPLVGPVYIVAPPNDVPQLKLKLFGQGIGTGVNIELSGDIIIDSGGGRSKATFDTVPDVPISSFDLDLPAGPHSILDAPNGDLCKGPITADLSIIAQNGKRQDTSPVIKVADCPKIPRAKIVSVKVSRSGVTVKVKPAAVGTLTVGGAKLVKVTRSIPRPNVTYTIVQRLSAAGKRAVARNGSVKVTPTVAYRPTNGPKTLTSKSKPVTVKGKKTVK